MWRSPVIAGALVCGASAVVILAGADKRAKTSIQASDLLKDVEVIGILGKPLGALVTIRGTWHGVIGKDGLGLFKVSHVDGNPLASAASFKVRSIRAIHSGGEPATSHGIDWDWKAAVNGKQRPPGVLGTVTAEGIIGSDDIPEGETWELVGAERGDMSVSFDKKFTDEMGGPWIQMGGSGYQPRFTFIALRKLGKPK